MESTRTLPTAALAASLTLLTTLLWFGAPAVAEPQATASQQPVTQLAASKSATSKKKAAHAAAPANVMRGPDNVALVGRLPWWRSDRLQTVRYLDKAVASQVLTTADAWLGMEPDGIQEAMEDAGRDAYDAASYRHRERPVVDQPMVDRPMVDRPMGGPLVVAADESVGVGSGTSDASVQEPNELNALDLASAEPAMPTDYSSLKGWLALLGGAIAAASTARFLFV